MPAQKEAGSAFDQNAKALIREVYELAHALPAEDHLIMESKLKKEVGHLHGAMERFTQHQSEEIKHRTFAFLPQTLRILKEELLVAVLVGYLEEDQIKAALNHIETMRQILLPMFKEYHPQAEEFEYNF